MYHSLLKADLARIFKHRSTVYTMFIVLLVIALAYAVLVPLVQEFLKNSNPNAATDLEIQKTGFGLPIKYLVTSLLLFGNAGFLICWAVTSVSWADIRMGYDRTIISGCGKRVYYEEKLQLACIISFLFVYLVALIGCIASGIVSGYDEIGSVIDILLLCLYTSVISWGCASVSLVVLWLTRNSTISYIVGFVLCTGILSTVIYGVLGNFGPDVQQAWMEFMKCLPTGAFSALQNITDGHIQMGDNALRLFVAPAVCLVFSYAFSLHYLTKRDL
jgi:hypothetical protein